MPVSLWFLSRFHSHAERDLSTVLLSIVAFNTEKLHLVVESIALSLARERKVHVTALGTCVWDILSFLISGV